MRPALRQVRLCVVRTVMLGLAVALACSKPAPAPAAEIIDLSTSVEKLRADFDAHADEPRFVTLVAPT
ncbi:MAG TPA: hypothetical protein VFQ53_12805 [Kofleriaceae bacterium]|nr:hypothetical protein [Kofleriaceae bacterium]